MSTRAFYYSKMLPWICLFPIFLSILAFFVRSNKIVCAKWWVERAGLQMGWHGFSWQPQWNREANTGHTNSCFSMCTLCIGIDISIYIFFSFQMEKRQIYGLHKVVLCFQSEINQWVLTWTNWIWTIHTPYTLYNIQPLPNTRWKLFKLKSIFCQTLHT